MGLFSDFKRYDGFTGNVPQKFYDASFPVCPLCGSKNPYWTLHQKYDLTTVRMQAKCKDCGGVISSTLNDYTGRTKSKAARVLLTDGLINAAVKKSQGKDVDAIYIRIDDLGTSEASRELLNKELTIEQVQAMGSAFDLLGSEE